MNRSWWVSEYIRHDQAEEVRTCTALCKSNEKFVPCSCWIFTGNFAQLMCAISHKTLKIKEANFWTNNNYFKDIPAEWTTYLQNFTKSRNKFFSKWNIDEDSNVSEWCELSHKNTLTCCCYPFTSVQIAPAMRSKKLTSF